MSHLCLNADKFEALFIWLITSKSDLSSIRFVNMYPHQELKSIFYQHKLYHSTGLILVDAVPPVVRAHFQILFEGL